jgi:DNA-directed RNA polymerase subunit delta
MLDITFEFLTKRNEPVSFKEIWDNAVEVLGLSEEESNSRLAKFYTNLMLDGRFFTLGDNVWDLKSKHKFDEIHMDMNEVYNNEESSDANDDKEEDEEDDLLEEKEDKEDSEDEDGEEKEDSGEDY